MEQDFIYVSGEMEGIMKMIQKAATSNATVLLTGESGTGKEKLAQLIHFYSNRAEKPFVAVNCAAIPETLLEAELFGVVKGAYTSADKDRIGLLEAANGGTVFIDEIGDLPLAAQIKLLRFLQDKMFTPIGSIRPKQVDVRIISATNKDPESLILQGKFRDDLLYRLNVIHIHIPPLRYRRSDIRPLVEYFVEVFAKQNQKTIRGIDPAAWKKLLSYAWLGNVRELKNVVERAVILANQEILYLSDFQFQSDYFIKEKKLEDFTQQRQKHQIDKKSTETNTTQTSETKELPNDNGTRVNQFSSFSQKDFLQFIQNLLKKSLTYINKNDVAQIKNFRQFIEDYIDTSFTTNEHLSKYHLLTTLYDMELVYQALLRFNGNKSKAAHWLGLSEKNIRDRLKKWQIEFCGEPNEDYGNETG